MRRVGPVKTEPGSLLWKNILDASIQREGMKQQQEWRLSGRDHIRKLIISLK
jgi:hypothetical protein